MKKRFTLFLGALLGASGLFAQDIHFSQVINNPLLINPANAGGFEGYERIVLNYRNQWAAVGSTFNTMGFSFDMPLFQGRGDKAYMGLGINFFSDKAGDGKFGLSQGNFTVSGIVPIDRSSRLAAGVQIGYGQRSADLSKLQWGSQFNGLEFDPTMPSFEANRLASFGYTDLSAGMRYEFRNTKENPKVWSVRRFTVGGAYYHLNTPEMRYFSGGSEKLSGRIVVHGMGEINLPLSKVSVIPFGTWFSQANHNEINVGALFRIELSSGTKITGLRQETALYAGMQHRLNDAIIPFVGYEMGSFSLGVSYDINVSTLNKASRGMGGFEISLKYHNLKKAIFKRRQGNRLYE